MELYGEVKEAISSESTDPRGKESYLRMYMNSDNANDKNTRLSKSGFMILIDIALIKWFSRNQSAI